MRIFDQRTTSVKESDILATLNAISEDDDNVIGKIIQATPTFPLKVQIQTATRCNAACGMCPYPEITGEPGFRHQLMDEGLYRSILEQMQGRGVQRLALFLMNEPLLDRRLPTWLAWARQELPTTKLTMFSNGSALTEKTLHRLADSGLHELTISVHGFVEETYERVMQKLSYQKVFRNLNRAIDAYNSGHLGSLKLHLVTGDIDQLHQEAIPDKFLPFVDRKSFSNERSAAETTPDLPSSPIHPTSSIRPLCQRPFVKLYILTNGQCVLCNVDWRKTEVLGDLSTGQKIDEIWNGERYQRVRLAHLRRNWHRRHICTRCDYPMVVQS